MKTYSNYQRMPRLFYDFKLERIFINYTGITTIPTIAGVFDKSLCEVEFKWVERDGKNHKGLMILGVYDEKPKDLIKRTLDRLKESKHNKSPKYKKAIQIFEKGEYTKLIEWVELNASNVDDAKQYAKQELDITSNKIKQLQEELEELQNQKKRIEAFLELELNEGVFTHDGEEEE